MARSRISLTLLASIFTLAVVALPATALAGPAVTGGTGNCSPGPFAACAGASLTLADLGRADLRGADLRGAEMNGAFLHGASLAGADLRGADLRGADLTAADLTGAALAGANLADATLDFTRMDRNSLADTYLCRTSLDGDLHRRDCAADTPPVNVPRGLEVSADVAEAADRPDDGEDARPLAGPPPVASAAAVSRRPSTRSRARAPHRARRAARHRTRLVVRVKGPGRVIALKGKVRYRTVSRKGAINCPGRCRTRFPQRATVPMKARPAKGARLVRWQRVGRRCATRTRCVIRTKKARRLHLTAVFERPSTPLRPACPVPATRDSDGDGLTDCAELAGWDLTITTPSDLSHGQGPQPIEVSSDPDLADTDGDGVGDGDEFRFNSNPEKADTDRDDLADSPELRIFGTLPNHADSDGDSKAPESGERDSRFFDGNEVRDLSTSPRLADTDGDGVTDLVEVSYENTNPRIADLPKVALEGEEGLSNPKFDLSYEIEETTGTEKETATTTQMADSAESSTERSRETTNEHTFESETGGKCGVSTKEAGCSVEQKFTYSTTHSLTEGTRTSFSNTHETSNEYEQIARTSSERKVTLGPTGCMQVLLNLHNTGTASVSVGNLQVLAWTPDPDRPNESSLLAALLPVHGEVYSGDCPATDGDFGDVTLAPGAKAKVVFSQQVSSADVLEYMAEPTPIQYDLGPISMKGTDMLGRPVDFAGQVASSVNNRDASIEVDFGDGTIVDYSVAANAPLSDGGDGFRQVTLGEALGADLAGLDPEFTEALPVSIESLRNPETGETVANAGNRQDGVWNLFGDADGIGDDSQDWQDIRLHPGDQISITYTKDVDRDQLPDGYEEMIGTDPDNADTDSDGLDDHFEARVGWTVPYARDFKPEYRIYPSPLSCDVDGDDSPDGPGPGTETDPCPTSAYAPESERKTDPTLTDTNGDGVFDGKQALPDALRAVPVGGRMPVQLRHWGGNGQFGPDTSPAGIAVDGNQPLVDSNGHPAPVDSYVIVRTPFGLSDEIAKFTGNPRGELPWRHTLGIELPDEAFGLGSSGRNGVATGIAVGRGSVGTGDQAGPPVVVNYYTKEHPGVFPNGLFGNMFGTFNGTTGQMIISPDGPDGTVRGLYGEGICCFFNPYMFSNPPATLGNGYLDTVGPNRIVIGHAFNRTPELNATATGWGSSEKSSLPSEYFGNLDTAQLMMRFGDKPSAADALDPAPGEITDPAGVAVDRVNDRLYVADDIGRNPDGSFVPQGALTRFDVSTGEVEAHLSDDSGALAGLTGIAVDPSGRYLYALSQTNGTMYKLSPSLAILGRLGSVTTPPFQAPVDLDVDARDGIWVVDQATKLIHFYFYPFGP